jgi:2-succinyl-5-enolpyruvyl-6-hydroxy-3-cyclohexene-1-carboxylate synthase
MHVTDKSTAAVIARFLRAQGIEIIFALCGGHIMPIWMRAAAEGIRIIDVRDERAAVHMAHAHAELTEGLGVALVTAGPGVTNALTGIANAHVSRAPVLVLSGTPPRLHRLFPAGRTSHLPPFQLEPAHPDAGRDRSVVRGDSVVRDRGLWRGSSCSGRG